MELHGARAQIGEVEPLDRAVVEGDVRRLGGVARPHRKAVVLARDEHATGGPLEHGVVRAAMAERKLVRLVTRRETEKLMTETDTENGGPAEQALDLRHLVAQRL